jgi:hypothetical protein
MNPVLSSFNAQRGPRPSATTAEVHGVGVNFFYVSTAAGDGRCDRASASGAFEKEHVDERVNVVYHFASMLTLVEG